MRPEPGIDGPPVWMVDLDAVLARPRHHFLRFIAGLHGAEPNFAQERDARFGQILEVLLDHALFEHRCAGMELHAAGPEAGKRRCAVMASALRPTTSLGRPGR